MYIFLFVDIICHPFWRTHTLDNCSNRPTQNWPHWEEYGSMLNTLTSNNAILINKQTQTHTHTHSPHTYWGGHEIQSVNRMSVEYLCYQLYRDEQIHAWRSNLPTTFGRLVLEFKGIVRKVNTLQHCWLLTLLSSNRLSCCSGWSGIRPRLVGLNWQRIGEK